MFVDELFEHGISIEKTVWKHTDGKISRQKVKRIIATDINSRDTIKLKGNENER